MKKLFIAILSLLTITITTVAATQVDYTLTYQDGYRYDLTTGAYTEDDRFSVTTRISLYDSRIYFNSNTFHHLLLFSDNNIFLGYYNTAFATTETTAYKGNISLGQAYIDVPDNVGKVSFMIYKNANDVPIDELNGYTLNDIFTDANYVVDPNFESDNIEDSYSGINATISIEDSGTNPATEQNIILTQTLSDGYAYANLQNDDITLSTDGTHTFWTYISTDTSFDVKFLNRTHYESLLQDGSNYFNTINLDYGTLPHVEFRFYFYDDSSSDIADIRINGKANIYFIDLTDLGLDTLSASTVYDYYQQYIFNNDANESIAWSNQTSYIDSNIYNTAVTIGSVNDDAIGGYTYAELFEDSNMLSTDFSLWGNFASTDTIAQDIISVTSNGAGYDGIIYPITNDINDKIYYNATVKSDSNTVRLGIFAYGFQDSHTGSGEYEFLSYIYAIPAANRLVFIYEDDTIITTFDVKYATALNLTALFGAGNEPTQAVMDALYEEYIALSTAAQESYTYYDLFGSGEYNLINNGDFSDTLSYWASNHATLSIINDKLYIEPTSNVGYINYTVDIIQPNHIYYSSGEYETINPYNGTSGLYYVDNYVGGNIIQVRFFDNITSQYGSSSHIFKSNVNYTFVLYDRYYNANLEDWYLDNVMLYDLTAIYGEGNEPSLSEFETLLNYYNNNVGAKHDATYNELFESGLDNETIFGNTSVIPNQTTLDYYESIYDDNNLIDADYLDYFTNASFNLIDPYVEYVAGTDDLLDKAPQDMLDDALTDTGVNTDLAHTIITVVILGGTVLFLAFRQINYILTIGVVSLEYLGLSLIGYVPLYINIVVIIGIIVLVFLSLGGGKQNETTEE